MGYSPIFPVQTPGAMPLSIRCTVEVGIVHFFLRPPPAVIRSQKGVVMTDGMPLQLVDAPGKV